MRDFVKIGVLSNKHHDKSWKLTYTYVAGSVARILANSFKPIGRVKKDSLGDINQTKRKDIKPAYHLLHFIIIEYHHKF